MRKLGGEVFGLIFELGCITKEQQALVAEREEARRQKDFHKADRIRQQLAAQGVIIEDTERGPLVRRKR
jgi:cysteinyl-tRNA synthetase